LGSSNRVGPGNNQSVVSERGDTAHLIDQGRFTKDELITSYSTADRKTITTHFALKRMSTYSTSSYIGAILCPIFGIFAVKNSLKAKYSKIEEHYSDTLKYSNRAYYFARAAIYSGLLIYITGILFILYALGLWSWRRPISNWFTEIDNPALNFTKL